MKNFEKVKTMIQRAHLLGEKYSSPLFPGEFDGSVFPPVRLQNNGSPGVLGVANASQHFPPPPLNGEASSRLDLGAGMREVSHSI